MPWILQTLIPPREVDHGSGGHSDGVSDCRCSAFGTATNQILHRKNSLAPDSIV